MKASIILYLSIILLSTVIVECNIPKHRLAHKVKQLVEKNIAASQKQDDPLNITTRFFEQKVNHLQFNDDRTFLQKYFFTEQYMDKTQKVFPIFFYCGNEGPIEMFFNNSGFLNYELSQQFNALLVYMEHRYFGKSQPFHNESESYKKENLVYLTSLQALHDFVDFITWLKYEVYECPECPVIAFGGSYGGMMASWIRMKFPNTFDGAIAASAPIVQFANRKGLDLGKFFKITTDNYRNADNCSDIIREAYKRIAFYISKPTLPAISALNKGFNICPNNPIKNATGIQTLKTWLDTAFQYMAMTNYPYPTSFLKDLPAWPANSSCSQLKGIKTYDNDLSVFTGVRKAAMYYYNYNNLDQCNDIFNSNDFDEDMSGWDILACADMVMPMESNGVDDMFNPEPWNFQAYSDDCNQRFGLIPNANWTLDFYGGITDEEYKGYSNIFFSNGMLDPWGSGGVYIKDENKGIGFDYMPMSAHHLDLRRPNQNDPVYVQDGRNKEIQMIQKWIDQKSSGYSKNDKKQIEQ